MKVIGYACQNTLSQQPRNLTLSRQERLISEFAVSKNWELQKIFREVITTNSGGGQPKLDEIIRLAGERKFDALVVARLDRLTRNIRQLNALINTLCIQNHVTLISIEEGLDTVSKNGQLALKIIDIVTKWDTKRISDRTREIIAKKRAKGERVGHAPFGLTYRNKKLVPVRKEQETVNLIQEKRNDGMSYHKIAKHLNERKIPSKRGGVWYAETVKTVFQKASAA